MKDCDNHIAKGRPTAQDLLMQEVLKAARRNPGLRLTEASKVQARAKLVAAAKALVEAGLIVLACDRYEFGGLVNAGTKNTSSTCHKLYQLPQREFWQRCDRLAHQAAHMRVYPVGHQFSWAPLPTPKSELELPVTICGAIKKPKAGAA